MSILLGFDTETTGLPDWKKPSGDSCQPHIVQLAAQLVDSDTQEVSSEMDVIVKPDGWVIPNETIEVHGITNEHAMDVGIPEKEALEMFLSMWTGCDKRIAYNTTFDNRIIRIATKRYMPDITINAWKEGAYECSMMLSKKAMKVKSVKLVNAYEHFIGKAMEDAHDAMADTKGCMAVYFAAKAQLED